MGAQGRSRFTKAADLAVGSPSPFLFPTLPITPFDKSLILCYYLIQMKYLVIVLVFTLMPMCLFAAATLPFFDDFSTDQGWVYDTEWQRGGATVSSGQQSGYPDPASDHSPSGDNYLAGAAIGANVSFSPHDFYYLTSPVLDAGSVTALQLSFWHWLNSDFPPYMESVVEVFDGNSWVRVYNNVAGVAENEWVESVYDVSAYANANFQVRFGHRVGNEDVYRVSGWNVDDVLVGDPSSWTATETPTAIDTPTETPTPTETATPTVTPTTCITAVPFSDGFETAGLECQWTTSSTNEGRIRVTGFYGPAAGSYHLLLDDAVDDPIVSLNEAVLHLNLTGVSNRRLRFKVREYDDTDNVLPSSFSGSAIGDGIAISEDGVLWYTLVSLGASWSYLAYDLDLEAPMAAAGFSDYSHIRIKFQQFGDGPIPQDGFAYDEIEVVSVVVAPTATPTVTPTACLIQPPFYDGFETGALSCFWTVSSERDGRIRVSGEQTPANGFYHLLMDDAALDSAFSLNELVLHIDISGESNLRLEFDLKGFSDERHLLPASFSGSANGDGVAISEDGVNWYTISSFNASAEYTHRNYDLDAAVSAAGLVALAHLRVKFQQYDDYPMVADGLAFDNIQVAAAGFAPSPTPTPYYTPTPPAALSSYVYPQPAARQLRIVYALPEAANTVIYIYNFSGVLVAELEHQGEAGGTNQVKLSLTGFAPGVYYYVVRGRGVTGRKIVVGPHKFLVVK